LPPNIRASGDPFAIVFRRSRSTFAHPESLMKGEFREPS
jgi:hypothetical protein